MAQFSEVLAKKTLDAIKGTASGLVEGAKGALVSQVPGFALSAAKFFNDVKKEVEESNKNQNEEEKKQTEEQKKQTEEQKKQTKEEKKQSQYLGDSNKWLDQLAKDTRIMRDKLARDDKFAEEVNNEKKLLDEKMLSTLEDIRDSLAGQGVAGDRAKKAAEEGGGSGILGGLAGTAATSILGGAAGGAGAAAAGGVMARYILPAMRAIIPRILPLLLTAIRFAGPVGLVAGTGLTLASVFSDKENKDKFKIPGGKLGEGAGQKSPIKTQGEFLERTKKYFGGSEEAVKELNQGRIDKYIADVSKKETKTNDPDNEINPTSYAMGKIQLMPFVVKELSSKVPGLDKSFASLPIKSEDDKKEFVEKWKNLSPAEKQKFYTAYVKQNYESLTGAIGRAPTESEFYAAQFGVTNVANAIKNQNAPLTSAQNAAAVANASALGVPASEQKTPEQQSREAAEQRRKAADERVVALRQEDSNLQKSIVDAENRLKANNEEYHKSQIAIDLEKEAAAFRGRPVDQNKINRLTQRMETLKEEGTLLQGEVELRRQARLQVAQDLKNAQRDAKMSSEQQRNDQAAAAHSESLKRQEKSESDRQAAAALFAQRVEERQQRDAQNFQPLTTLVGVDRNGQSLNEPIAPSSSILPIPFSSAATSAAPVAPTARSIVVVPPVAVANTSQTQTAFQTPSMVPPWAAATSGLLPLTGNLDFGQSQLYTPGTSGTDTQKFEAKSIVELMLESLKKIEQNTAKTAQGQAESNKRAENDRKSGATGRGRGSTTVPFRPTLSGKGPAQDAARDKFYTDRFARIIESTGNITKNLINSELNKLFFPKGQIGVSRTQGDQLGFLASVAGRELKLGQKSTQFLSKIFGNKIGRAYGGVAGEALGLGIEQFAGAAGRGLGFGGELPDIFGNKFQSFNIGQILGNFAGNKQQRKLAREQLIYNFTGIPTGSDTLLRTADRYLNLGIVDENGKISFDKLATAGGDFVSKGLSSLFGIPIKGAPGAARPAPATVTKINPETGETYQALAEPGAQAAAAPQQGIFGGFFDRLFGRGPSGTAVPNAPRPISAREQNAFLEANGELPKQLETTNETLADQSTKKDDQGFFGGMIDSIAGLGRSLMSIFTGAGGGSGGFGGGGMGGGGGGNLFEDFLGTAGNIVSNIGTLYLSSKLTKNIKNPTTRMLANLVVNQGLQYGLKTFVMPALGSAFSAAFPAAASALVAASPKIAGMLNVTGSVANPGALYGPTTSIPTNSVLADAAAAGGGGGGAAAAGGGGGGAAAAGGGAAAVSDLTGGVDLGTVTGSNMDLLTTGGDVSTAVSDLTGGVDLGAINDLGLQAGQAIDAGVIATDTPFALANDIAGASDVAATASSDILGGMDLSTVGTVLNVLTIGYKLSQGQYGSAAGQAIGSYLGGPIGAFIGSMLGGALDDAFGKTPHLFGFSKTQGSGWDRSFGADTGVDMSENYRKVTDTLARSAQTILNTYAEKVGSKSRFDVAISIGSDNNDGSVYIYFIYKDGNVVYSSGNFDWGNKEGRELPSSFSEAVKEFVAKRMNPPLVQAMRTLDLTEAQKSDLNRITDYTQTSQIADFVNKGATDASLLDATYKDVTTENAGFDQVDFVSGGESGNDTSVTTPMVWSMKDKAFVPIKETVTATGTSTDDMGNAQTYSYQAVDRTVLGYDENGNPIRAADLNRKVGTATPATTVTGNTAASGAASDTTGTATASGGTTGGTASAAPASGGTTGASNAIVTADNATPVTDYYNQTQESLNQAMDTIATGGAGNNTSIVAPTNVVDNSVRTNTTIVNTDTRNSDPVLFRSSRRAAFVD